MDKIKQIAWDLHQRKLADAVRKFTAKYGPAWNDDAETGNLGEWSAGYDAGTEHLKDFRTFVQQFIDSYKIPAIEYNQKYADRLGELDILEEAQRLLS